MLHLPYWFERSRIAGEARDDVPVDMGELVAQEFVIDLLSLINLCNSLGDQIYLFHELKPLRRRQVKEFRGVAVEDDYRPAGKELIVMEKGFRQSEIRNEMIVSRPNGLAGLACRVAHG